MTHPFFTPEILAAIDELVDQAPPLPDRAREIIRAAFATVRVPEPQPKHTRARATATSVASNASKS